MHICIITVCTYGHTYIHGYIHTCTHTYLSIYMYVYISIVSTLQRGPRGVRFRLKFKPRNHEHRVMGFVLLAKANYPQTAELIERPETMQA